MKFDIFNHYSGTDLFLDTEHLAFCPQYFLKIYFFCLKGLERAGERERVRVRVKESEIFPPLVHFSKWLKWLQLSRNGARKQELPLILPQGNGGPRT